MRKHAAILFLICGLALAPTVLIIHLARNLFSPWIDALPGVVVVAASTMIAVAVLAAIMIAAGAFAGMLSGSLRQTPEQVLREAYPLWDLCVNSDDFSRLPGELLSRARYTHETKLESFQQAIFQRLLAALKQSFVLSIPASTPPAVSEHLLRIAFTAQGVRQKPPRIRRGGRSDAELVLDLFGSPSIRALEMHLTADSSRLALQSAAAASHHRKLDERAPNRIGNCHA